MFYFNFLAFWRPWDGIIYNPPSDDCCINIQPCEEENFIKAKKQDILKEEKIFLKKKQTLKIKKCEVCGDVADGTNYGVPSCRACKYFFLRNGHKDSLFGPCDRNCDVTPFSRNHCKKCRLNKCHIVGMKRKLNADVYDSRISSISTFSPQDEMKSPKRKFKETIVKLYNDRLLKQVISREEKVPILGTIKFIN